MDQKSRVLTDCVEFPEVVGISHYEKLWNPLDKRELRDFRSTKIFNVGEFHLIFFSLLNTITFHSRMVDQLEETISDTSDLSIFCFYARLFEDHFQASVDKRNKLIRYFFGP